MLKYLDACSVKRFPGIAFRYYGEQTEPGPSEVVCGECNGKGEDCEYCCNGMVYDEEPEDVPTGMVVVVMVGDDHKHIVDPSDVEKLSSNKFCHECGQIGCGHSLRDEDEDDDGNEDEDNE